MNNSSLFVPEMISEALRSDLATGLRAIADALEASSSTANLSARTLRLAVDTITDCTFASCSMWPLRASSRALAHFLH
jgi:hypothetical protein